MHAKLLYYIVIENYIKFDICEQQRSIQRIMQKIDNENLSFAKE